MTVTGGDPNPSESRYELYGPDLTYSFILRAGTAKQPTTYEPADDNLIREVIGTIVLTDSSKKFLSLGTSSSVDTTSWKTYSDPVYGFEIKYPSNWFQSIHGANLVLSTGDLQKGDSPSISIAPEDGTNNLRFVIHDKINSDLSREVISTLKFNSSAITFRVVQEEGSSGNPASAEKNNNSDLIVGRICGGGAMGNSGMCPVGYYCRVVTRGPPADGTCQMIPATSGPVTAEGAVYNNVRIQDASTLTFTDTQYRSWAVNYQQAKFSEYSATYAKVHGTSGLQPTTLQEWLQTQKHVGEPLDQSGAPGTITITGTVDTSGVLVASSIVIYGQ